MVDWTQILVAVISGGMGVKLLDIVARRLSEIRGKRRTARQVIDAYKEALARTRFLAIKAGVDPKELPPAPEDTT